MVNMTSVVQLIQSVDYSSIVKELFLNTYIDLLLFTTAICAYALFVWVFYKQVSKRDLFKLDLNKYNIEESFWNVFKIGWQIFLYFMKYGVIFPLYIGFWFVTFTLILFLISKDVGVQQIITTSIIFVSTVRITAYIREELSSDLAKLLPLALLAVLIINPAEFSLNVFVSRIIQIPSLIVEIVKVLSFSVFLEWLIRMIYSVQKRFRGEEDSE